MCSAALAAGLRVETAAPVPDLNFIQWPAMVTTLVASWLVASHTSRKRTWGFWFFLLSNVLWIAWGWHSQAYALITLQVGLAVMNIRGVKKNDACM